jgi:hypothetical protein
MSKKLIEENEEKVKMSGKNNGEAVKVRPWYGRRRMMASYRRLYKIMAA